MDFLVIFAGNKPTDRKMKKLIIALLALGMMACHQPENTSLKVVEVDVNSSDYRKDEAAFKHFDFVKLDTVSEALLSDVSKVLVGEDRIYVLPVMDPRVFIFDGEGKYIHSLKKGQGPGEIRFVYDMDLHDGNLYVYDNYRTIRKYDKDGNFLEDVYTQDDYNLLMKVVEDQILLFDPYFNARQEHLLTVVTKDTTLHYFPKRKEMKSPFFLNMFYDEGYISWPVSDTIYHYDAIKMQPFPGYVVRFQQPNIYDAMRNEEITPERFTEITEDDYHCKWMNNPVVYGDQLFFSFKYDKLYYVRYKEGKSSIYSTLIEGLPALKVGARGRTGNRMIYAYSMPALMEHKEELVAIPEGKLQELYDQVTDEEDNPILVFAELE